MLSTATVVRCCCVFTYTTQRQLQACVLDMYVNKEKQRTHHPHPFAPSALMSMSSTTKTARARTTLVVAVCGKMRSGKDTVAAYLCERWNFSRVAFATPLKDAVSALFGMSVEQVEGAAKDVPDPRWGITPRRALQFIGTEVMQFAVHDHRLLPHVPPRTFWAQRLTEDILRQMQQHQQLPGSGLPSAQAPHFVVSDLRFPHELRTLRERLEPAGARVVALRVSRGGGFPLSSSSFFASSPASLHRSEREEEAIAVDDVIENSGTLEDLFRRVDATAARVARERECQ